MDAMVLHYLLHVVAYVVATTKESFDKPSKVKCVRSCIICVFSGTCLENETKTDVVVVVTLSLDHKS